MQSVQNMVMIILAKHHCPMHLRELAQKNEGVHTLTAAAATDTT